MNYTKLPKDELIKELEKLRNELEALKASAEKESYKQKKIEFELTERLKELNCHNRISQIMSNSSLSEHEVIQKIADIIPESMQFPEIAASRIKIYDKVYQSSQFKEMPNSLIHVIKRRNDIIGHLAVGYPTDQLPEGALLFLPEESNLIFSIAERLGNFIEKKQKDLELLFSDTQYKHLVENITDVIYTTDSHANITYVSPSVTKLLGYLPEQVIGKNFVHFVGESSDHLNKRFEEIQQKDELQNEYKITAINGETHWIRFSSKAIITNGIFAGVTGTLIDVTEKKLIELELERSEALYRSILNASPDTIFIADLEGKVQFVSPMALKMFGFEDTTFPINRSLFDFVDENDQAKARDAISRMFEGKFSGATEYTGIKADGSSFYMEVNGEFIRDTKGNPTSMVFVVRDITDRKSVENKLRISESLYKSVLDASPDTITITDLNGNILFSSPKALKMFGYTDPELLINRSVLEFIDQKYHDRVKNAIKDMVQGINLGAEVYAGIKADGSTFDIEVNGDFIRDENGQPTNMIIVTRDISDRKLAEEKLQKSEEQYRKLVESVNDVIYEIDEMGNIKFVSPSVSHVLGYSVEDVIGKNIFSYVYSEDVPIIMNSLKNLSNREYNYMEYRYIRKDGTVRWVRSSTSPNIQDGKITGATGTLTDVTERKFAEEKLRESEERFRMIFENVFDGISIFEEATDPAKRKLIDCNEQYAVMAGRSREELLELKYTYPLTKTIEDNANLERLQGISKNTAYHGSFRWLRPDGRDNIIEYIGRPITWHGNSYSIGIDRDITERIHSEQRLQAAQENLRKSEKKFRTITEQTTDLIAIADENGFITYASNSSQSMLLVSPEEMCGRHFTEFVDEKELTNAITHFRNCIEQNGRIRDVEFLMKRNDGSYFIGELNGSKYNTELQKGILVTIRDITEKKKAEDRLRKLSLAVEQSPVSIVITDLDGNIEYANPTVCETTGYAMDELIGKNPRVLKSGETPIDEYQFLWESISTGKIWKGIFHNKRKNGELYWESSQITPITDANGKIINYLALKEDITERKRIQEELSRSENRFREITEQSQNVIWETDSNAVYTFVSQASEIAWGIKPSDLIGKKRFFDIHPEEGRTEFMNACLSQVQKGEQFRNLESRILGDDGIINWVLTNGMPYFDAEGNVKGYRGSSLNINLQKNAFEALSQSEERYKSIFRNNHSVMMIVDPDTGDIKDVNNSACDYYKWTYDEICSKNISEINILTLQELKAELRKAKEEERTQFFFKHRLSSGEIRDVEVYSCPLKFGDSTLLFSIVHDITDRRIAEEALSQRERDLNFSQEIAGMGSWQLNMATNTSMWSDNMYRIFGLDPKKEKASQDLFFELIHPDDRHLIDEYMEKIHRDRKQVTFEIRINLKSGKTIWIQNSMIPGFEGDQLVTLNGTNVDITSKKLSEEALRNNEAALNQAQEISKMCSWELDLIAEKLTWSKNYYHLMGIPAGSEMNIHFFNERVHPEDRHIVDEKMEEMKLLRKPVTYDLRLRMPDNEYRWIQNYIVPEFENEILVRYKGVNIDVTEKKLDEESIKHQNERLSAIIGAIPDMILVADINGNCLEYYSSTPNMSAKPDNQMVGTNIREIFNEDIAKLYIKNVEKCLFQQRLITYEFLGNKKNSIRSLEVRLAPMGTERVLTFVRDITDEKLKDDEIKKLSLAVEQSPVIIVITDLNSKIEYVNPAFEAITGYHQDDVLGKKTNILKSGETDPKIYSDLWKTISSGIDWYGEWVNKKKNGELYWESVSITPIRDNTGKVTNYLAVKQDITQRKQIEQQIRDLNANLEVKIEERTAQLANTNENLLQEIEERKRIENALSKSEKNYRTVVENVNEVIFQTDPDGLWLFLNSSWEKVTGFTVEESVGKPFTDFVYPEDRARNWELFEPLIKRQKDHCRHEIRYLSKDGGFRWIDVYARVGINEKDEITGTYGSLQDITERKLAEDALHWSQSLLQLMSNSSPLGFLVVDNRTDEILYFNERFCQIWGIEELTERMRRGEMKNNDIIPYCLPVLADVPAFAESCKPLQAESNRIIIEDDIAFTGNRTIHRYSTQIRGEHDEYYGRFYIFEDITERKRAEAFENELLQLSPKLTGVTSSEITQAINMALSRIGQFLSADRAYIFEYNNDKNTLSNTFEWCNIGITAKIGSLQNIPLDLLPNWKRNLNNRENIIIPSVKDLPESWLTELEILEPQGIQSLIAIPIEIETIVVGFVGLDSVVLNREYNLTEINILKVWSSMLASLINNQRNGKLLEQTRQNYETFFNTIDDFLFVLDEQGNIIHTNNTVTNRLEYSSDELISQSVLMVHPPERREEAGRIVGEMLAGTADFCPVPLVTKSGSKISVETKVKKGFWDGNSAIFGVSKDVSQIILSEEKFSRAFHSSSALMAISDFEDGNFIDVNNAFVKTMGYSRDEVIGKNSTNLDLYVDKSIRKKIIEDLKQNIQVREIELEFKSKSGEIIIGLFSADFISVGNQLCLLTLFVDITERKRAEVELEKARIEAEKANLAKSEFLSRMSHELRTPMNSILGFAQLLEMGILNPTQKKGVDHILNSGKHLLDLINEVLDIARIEAGHIALSIEPVKLDGIIQEMMDTFLPLISTSKLKMELADSPSNALFVMADRQRLKQILLNLISNAVKYNRPNGSIIIKTELKPINRLGGIYLRISISDTGFGIIPEDIQKLFNPFERIGAEKSTIEGSGLGLAVVKKLTAAMGGQVGIESVINEGSTFWIELPCNESQFEHLEKSNHLSKIVTDTVQLSGKVLYIEDNESNIKLVEQILSRFRSGIEIISNKSGLLAVPLAHKHKPDLILLDLHLPDLQGTEVINQLKSVKDTRDIPVVIISADAMPDQIQKLYESGANNYLTKPLVVESFLAVIDELIVNKKK